MRRLSEDQGRKNSLICKEKYPEEPEPDWPVLVAGNEMRGLVSLAADTGGKVKKILTILNIDTVDEVDLSW